MLIILLSIQKEPPKVLVPVHRLFFIEIAKPGFINFGRTGSQCLKQDLAFSHLACTYLPMWAGYIFVRDAHLSYATCITIAPHPTHLTSFLDETSFFSSIFPCFFVGS